MDYCIKPLLGRNVAAATDTVIWNWQRALAMLAKEAGEILHAQVEVRVQAWITSCCEVDEIVGSEDVEDVVAYNN